MTHNLREERHGIARQKRKFIKQFTEIHRKRHFDSKILQDFIDFTWDEIKELEK